MVAGVSPGLQPQEALLAGGTDTDLTTDFSRSNVVVELKPGTFPPVYWSAGMVDYFEKGEAGQYTGWECLGGSVWQSDDDGINGDGKVDKQDRSQRPQFPPPKP